jgi:hypothetical protein
MIASFSISVPNHGEALHHHADDDEEGLSNSKSHHQCHHHAHLQKASIIDLLFCSFPAYCILVVVVALLELLLSFFRHVCVCVYQIHDGGDDTDGLKHGLDLAATGDTGS